MKGLSKSTVLYSHPVEVQCSVIFCGFRNRAVHGDVVVVELFPKSQWKGRSMAIRSSNEGLNNLKLILEM